MKLGLTPLLCAPPTANESVLVHHDGGQRTARPTNVKANGNTI
jgi:hypothetical protein